MARPLRIEYKGALYHVFARGNERQKIFRNKADYTKFLHYIQMIHDRYKIVIYSYCLMENHYHLLIETPHANLSWAMKDLNGAYTMYFNTRHQRVGHLFQSRYKAILVDKEHSLAAVSRYIHLNPVKAGIVKRPELYAFSSMKNFTDPDHHPQWLSTQAVLEKYDKGIVQQQNKYRDYINEKVSASEDIFKNVYAQAMLGSKEFIKNIFAKYIKKEKISPEILESKRLMYCLDLDDVKKAVTGFYKVDDADLMKRKTRNNDAKKMYVFFARNYTDAMLRHIQESLGMNIAEISISKIHTRVTDEVNRNGKYKKAIKNISQMLNV